jgi:hypothetical protein
MQVAALSVGVGAIAVALSASEAKADNAPGATAAAPALDPLAGPPAAELAKVRVTGWSCFTPPSRGPLAPPAQAGEDFEVLLAEVPA